MQPVCQLRLRQAGRFSLRDQCIAERFMSRTPDCLCHVSQTSCDRANLVYRLSKKWIFTTFHELAREAADIDFHDAAGRDGRAQRFAPLLTHQPPEGTARIPG